jgi:hypothetical protein
VLVLFAVAFGTNVATPLFLLYETSLDLSRWTVTALFAVYPLGLAPALAYGGPASDVFGRRTVMIPGLLLSGAASGIMLAGADDLVLLFVGRFVLGAASGIALVVGSAWMQEIDRTNPLWTARLLGIVIYGGFGAGPLVGSIFGQWGPGRLVTPYLVHLALVAGALAVMRLVPETVVPVDRRVRPNLGIPTASRSMFWRVVAPTALGVFGLPSLTFGLFPVLLRPAMASVAVLVSGIVFVIAMGSIVPAQAWVGRVGPYRAAPLGLILGTAGCGLGLLAFATDAWPILFPASIMMGTASGLSMTSGLRFVDQITSPESRGALTGAFYAVAYAGMTMPVIVSTVAGPLGYTPVLAALTGVGALGAAWLVAAVRTTTSEGTSGAVT